MLAIRIKDLKCLTLAKSLAKTREVLNFAMTRKKMGSAIRKRSGRNVRRLVENAEAKYFFPNNHLLTINLMHIFNMYKNFVEIELWKGKLIVLKL